jgi:serine/threonine protein phosphatase PrpC
MTLALHYALRSDVGLLREGNEDSAYAGPNLLAIADGMGGHAAGEVASAVAISALAPSTWRTCTRAARCSGPWPTRWPRPTRRCTR